MCVAYNVEQSDQTVHPRGILACLSFPTLSKTRICIIIDALHFMSLENSLSDNEFVQLRMRDGE